MKALYGGELTDLKMFAPLKEYAIAWKIKDKFSERQYVIDVGKPQITDAKQHFWENLETRPDRSGLNIDAAQGIINNSRLTLYQTDRQTLKFLADNGYVILNTKNEIVTVVPEKLRKNIVIIWRENDMARSPIARHNCPLYERETIWSECVEVQEVRADEMNSARLREPFDMDRANEVCEKCKWFVINDAE